jgi:hypothetical protein
MAIPIAAVIGTATTLFGALVALCATYMFFRESPRWGDLKKAMTYFTASCASFAAMGLVFAITYTLDLRGTASSIAANTLYFVGLLFLLLGAREIAKYSAMFRYDGRDKALSGKKARKRRK